MFEILKALMALKAATEEHGGRLDWSVENDGSGAILHASIPLTDDDELFVENMRALVGPAD